jgi:phospholipase C
MGYYDGGDLNYYYSMATNFATSDRWFSPVMSRTPPNREFLIAATSNGYVNQRGKNPPLDSALIPAKTIFEALQAAGITWKIYVPNAGTRCASDTSPSCLIKLSYVKDFTFGQTIVNQYPQNLVPISQFITDAQNGTLPQVAQIEPASGAGLDEHPSDNDPPAGGQPCCSTQKGSQFVSTLINAVMCAPNSNPCTPGKSWKDSAFILTFDEFGGFYDHVAPVPTVSPDGIPPVDLYPNDVCLSTPGPTCDFTYTGYRVPMILVSPFAKKNFVSHSTTDYTAILKLIEKRFGLGALTNRDAAQIDMAQEFFDFTNQPWMTPPNPQKQDTSKACYLDHLP